MSGCRRGRQNALQRSAGRSLRRPRMGEPMSELMKMNKIGTMLQVGRAFGVRDGMLRLEYELQRGSGLMSWRMRSVQGWDSWSLKRITAGTTAEQMRTARRDRRQPFFFADLE